MNEKHIFLTAAPRSGNTFLGFCLKEAEKLNHKQTIIHIAQNMHAPSLLAINQTDDVKIYTTFRDPLANIVSASAMRVLFSYGSDYKFDKNLTNFDDHILSSISEYNAYLTMQSLYMKSTIILFSNLISDTHSVIKKILEDIDVQYTNEIDIDFVKKNLDQNTQKISTNGDFIGSGTNLPFGIETMEYYPYLVEKINSFKEFLQLQTLYTDTMNKAYSAGCKIY